MRRRPAECGGARAGLEGVLGEGAAERQLHVGVDVDRARDHVLAGRVDRLVGGHARRPRGRARSRRSSRRRSRTSAAVEPSAVTIVPFVMSVRIVLLRGCTGARRRGDRWPCLDRRAGRGPWRAREDTTRDASGSACATVRASRRRDAPCTSIRSRSSDADLAVSINADGVQLVAGRRGDESRSRSAISARSSIATAARSSGWTRRWVDGHAGLDRALPAARQRRTLAGTHPPGRDRRRSGGSPSSIHPPRSSAATAGPWTFGAKVQSEHDPSDRSSRRRRSSSSRSARSRRTSGRRSPAGRFGAKTTLALSEPRQSARDGRGQRLRSGPTRSRFDIRPTTRRSLPAKRPRCRSASRPAEPSSSAGPTTRPFTARPGRQRGYAAGRPDRHAREARDHPLGRSRWRSATLVAPRPRCVRRLRGVHPARPDAVPDRHRSPSPRRRSPTPPPTAPPTAPPSAKPTPSPTAHRRRRPPSARRPRSTPTTRPSVVPARSSARRSAVTPAIVRRWQVPRLRQRVDLSRAGRHGRLRPPDRAARVLEDSRGGDECARLSGRRLGRRRERRRRLVGQLRRRQGLVDAGHGRRELHHRRSASIIVPPEPEDLPADP